jgi:phenylacetyl-CoA:acceptor oxidoreductase subunit 1
MPRWGMVIDLTKCIGCETCKHVCAEMNDVPAGTSNRRVIESELPTDIGRRRIFLPLNCMHCDKPPCLDVCPTGATERRSDGIILIDPQRCIGCGACILACPYGVRSIARQDAHFSTQNREHEKLQRQKTDRIGTCTKCDFCHEIIEAGISEDLKPGADPEATPLCARYCLSEAICFGDLDDPDSDVSRLIANSRAMRLCKESGTEPAVYYIIDD